MKKLMIAAAIVCATAFANAASVGWTASVNADIFENKYYFFVYGQNGVADLKTVTDVLDQAGDFSAYVYGEGTIAKSGSAYMASQAASTSGKTLGEGKYSGFFVFFDTKEPVAYKSKYLVVENSGTQNKTVGSKTTSINFAAGNVIAGTAKSYIVNPYGIPEPTSALLMLLGVAGLALKRRRA